MTLKINLYKKQNMFSTSQFVMSESEKDFSFLWWASFVRIFDVFRMFLQIFISEIS